MRQCTNQGLVLVFAMLLLAAEHALGCATSPALSAPPTGTVNIARVPMHRRADLFDQSGLRIYVPRGRWFMGPVKTSATGLRIEGPGWLVVKPQGPPDQWAAGIELLGADCHINTGVNVVGRFYAAVRLRANGHVGGEWMRVKDYLHKGVTVNHQGQPIDSITIDGLHAESSKYDPAPEFSQVAVQIDPREFPVREAVIRNVRIGRQASGNDSKGPIAIKAATCEKLIIEDCQHMSRHVKPGRQSIVLAENLGEVILRRNTISGITHAPEAGFGDSLVDSLVIEENTFDLCKGEWLIHSHAEARVLHWRNNVIKEAPKTALIGVAWDEAPYSEMGDWDISGNALPTDVSVLHAADDVPLAKVKQSNNSVVARVDD